MTLDDLIKRANRAFQTHDRWKPLWDECYEYALPARARFFNLDTQGQKNTLSIYDSTAQVSLAEFASRLQAGLTPTFARWSRLKPGALIRQPDEAKKIQAKLDEIAEETVRRHEEAFGNSPVLEDALDIGGDYAFRQRGEAHRFYHRKRMTIKAFQLVLPLA